jgi:hypothetical protein
VYTTVTPEQNPVLAHVKDQIDESL